MEINANILWIIPGSALRLKIRRKMHDTLRMAHDLVDVRGNRLLEST